MKTKPAPCFDFVYVQGVMLQKLGKKEPQELMDTLLGLKAGKRIKNDFPPHELIPHLVEAVEAAIIVANSFEINLQYDLPRHYSTECGYCQEKPCNCNFLKDKPQRIVLEIPPVWWKTLTVDQFQKMDFEVYPRKQTRVDLLEMALHFEDEVKEVCRELNRTKIEVPDLLAETCDLLEKPFQLASILGIELTPFLEEGLVSKKKRRKPTATH